MGNVHKMSDYSEMNIKTDHKKQTLFQQALSELKKETGIDHYKLITGDEKERSRLNFIHFQEKLLKG